MFFFGWGSRIETHFGQLSRRAVSLCTESSLEQMSVKMTIYTNTGHLRVWAGRPGCGRSKTKHKAVHLSASGQKYQVPVAPHEYIDLYNIFTQLVSTRIAIETQ